MSSNKVVTRFAPSPTGFMHVGGVRTALYAWLWAKKNNGSFILRIEDTDKAREVPGSIEHIKEVLQWMGLDWDEGPDKGGPHLPYLQSDRLELYKRYAQILINKGLAYPDPYTSDELDGFRESAELHKKPFLYREYRPAEFEKWDGTKPLRFKIEKIGETKWNDLVYGDLSAGPEALDDFILIKSDGYPTYNFAHIVDDIEMGVTHVMRGQEFISSTPKFLAVYEALEVKPPFYATLPPIMAPDGKKKLGKRDGAKDILEYKKEGYIPEALVNFLALLGWNPGDDREIFSKKELINAFTLEKVQRSGARLDEQKLDWLNKEHIKKLSQEQFETAMLEWLPKEMRSGMAGTLTPVIMERISKWSDIKKMAEAGELDFFFKAPDITDKQKLLFKDATVEETVKNIQKAKEWLSGISDFKKEEVKSVLMDIAEELDSRGKLLHPVRYALTGLDKSPDPFIVSEILGKDETLSRLEKAVQILQN